ncbi:MAG: hypothetical protein Q4D86_10060 [Pasteurella oralis]|uniref:hypothetical protein n=1 Tax=Pasteurella oralis TaxID=1071947 RepID=UPI0026F98F65|nr:hypothetical protein [Pasteurella oralis]
MSKKTKVNIKIDKKLDRLPEAPIFKRKIEAAEKILSKLTEKDILILNAKS